jgi:hypothetical protein
MSKQSRIPVVELPSTGRIVAASAIAFVVAVVVLIVAVLPAEYGIDPLGTGKALGLLELANASAKPVATADGPATSINPVLVPSPTGDAPAVRNTFISQPARYKMDSHEIKLKPGEGMEIKYNMKKGAGLVYSWMASSPVQFEFHGEPDKKPEGKGGTDYYESYELDNKVGADHSHGTFVAPSTGIHGWFWENKSDKEVTLTLVSSGFYDFIIQNRDEKSTTMKVLEPEIVPGR